MARADTPKPGKTARGTEPVQLKADIVRKLRLICAYRQVSASAFIDPIVRKAVRAAYKAMQIELAAESDQSQED